MCCYKLVECEFKWFGLQGTVESRVQKVCTCTCFNEMRRKKEASMVKQTTIKAKQHSTPKAVTFPKKN